MSKFQVFDPAMCCSTGVCGPEVDPALVRFAADLEWLKERGLTVERFNLSQEPAAFVANPEVVAAMRGRDDALPLLLLDGKIVAQGAYPGRRTLAGLLGLPAPEGQEGEVTSGKAACCPPASAAPVTLGRPGGAPKKCC
jgi:hypothetical protein